MSYPYNLKAAASGTITTEKEINSIAPHKDNEPEVVSLPDIGVRVTIDPVFMLGFFGLWVITLLLAFSYDFVMRIVGGIFEALRYIL